MILTTTPHIEGHPIKEYKGIVAGEVISGANFLRDIKASFTDFFGGRSTTYENVLQRSLEEAKAEMTMRAEHMGANAIVGIDIDYETVGAENAMLMVSVSGTAVVI